MSASIVPSPIPKPDRVAARQVAAAFRKEGHILGALEALHETIGDVFQLPLPGFRSVMLVGPEANRFILTEARERLMWRTEGDPVTRLLRQGLLVTDGESHDAMRSVMSPALHSSQFGGYVQTMWQSADCVTDKWKDGARVDLLDEMRRVALLIVMKTLFEEDYGPQINTYWRDIARTIRYISPGLWLVWPSIPRIGYRKALRRMDDYFYGLIARRRAEPAARSDLLTTLIAAGMSDDLIRDQLLTLFIAGHDTSTALLAWSLYLLSTHPDSQERAQAEVDTIIGAQNPTTAHVRQLTFLDCVIKESLRLYPPIHLGSRVAATDLDFQGYRIPAGTRVLYSHYLTQRDKRYWPAPERFDPDRFSPRQAGSRPAYSFIPFGGGPRNCIGAAFAQVEAKIVLARLLQRYDFRYVGGRVRPRMRATLEPSPGVLVEARRRAPSCAPEA